MRGKGKSGATTAAKENAVNTVAKKAESTIEAVAEKAKEAVKKVEVKEEAVKETLAETKAEVKAEVKAAEKVVEKAAMGYLYTKNLLTAYNKSMKNLNVADFNSLNWSSWEWDKE